MPVTYDDMRVKIASQTANLLLIQIKLPPGVRRTLAQEREIIEPQVRRLLVQSLLGHADSLSVLRGSHIDNDAGILTLCYLISEHLIVRKKEFAFPARYFFSAVINNHGEIPQDFSVIEGNVDSDLFTYSKRTDTHLLLGGKKHAEISPQQWGTLYQSLSLKFKFVGQAYGIVRIKRRKTGILFCFSEDCLGLEQLAGSDVSQPFPIKERVKTFVGSSIDMLAQELLEPNEALWSKVFEIIEIEKSLPNDDGEIDLRLRFPQIIKQWLHIFLLNLQQKIEYARHFGVDAGVSLFAVKNDGYNQQDVTGEVVLRCNLVMDIDHREFIALLCNLPENQDLLDMLRLIRCRDADSLDKRLQETYKNRGGLLGCLADYYLSVDKDLSLALVVLQELVSSLERRGERATSYYNYIAQKVVEIVDGYIIYATSVSNETSLQRLKELKNQLLIFLISTDQDTERAKFTFFEWMGIPLRMQATSSPIHKLKFGLNRNTVIFLGEIGKQLTAKLTCHQRMLKKERELRSSVQKELEKERTLRLSLQGMLSSQQLFQSVEGDVSANTGNRKRRCTRSQSTDNIDNKKRLKINNIGRTTQFFMSGINERSAADQMFENSCHYKVTQL